MGEIMLGFESTETGMKVVGLTNDVEIEASAVIISRKVDGIWQRSTQYLMPKSSVSNVPGIIALWELSTTEIPTENPYYLNNADL